MKGIFNSKTVSVAIASVVLLVVSSCSDINTVNDPHFESDGTFITDSTERKFSPEVPTQVRFFVEVSGSMNGFFRANLPTHFKADVWQVLSYYSGISPEVTILTNDGDMGANIAMSDFQTKMNTGAFISAASTKVPLMLKSIIANLHTEEGEVAVLISDLKYSPVGSAAPQVLLSQYSTDISKILGNYGKAVSLIGATSNFLDKSGQTVAEQSPYYFFVIGEGKHVASVRNVISSMLEMKQHLIDNIDSGFDFGTVSCTFGIPENCYQLNEDQPTFVDFQGDTCTIKMKVDLENYRWIITRPEVFSKVFSVKPLYGSNVKVENIEFNVKNITEKDHTNLLVRKATALVELKVFDLASDSEVIEWNLDLPDTNESLFTPYFGATAEEDVTKSYLVDNFIRGMYQSSVVNKSLKPNYILISKNS